MHRRAVGPLYLNPSDLRPVIRWGRDYRREWDRTPDAYVDNGLVGWARSKRLGMYEEGTVKAYIGVQHVDPSLPGWGSLNEAQARFFLSTFTGSRCIALRVFPTIDDTLDALYTFITT